MSDEKNLRTEGATARGGNCWVISMEAEAAAGTRHTFYFGGLPAPCGWNLTALERHGWFKDREHAQRYETREEAEGALSLLARDPARPRWPLPGTGTRVLVMSVMNLRAEGAPDTKQPCGQSPDLHLRPARLAFLDPVNGGGEREEALRTWYVVRTGLGVVRYLSSWDGSWAMWTASPVGALSWGAEDPARRVLDQLMAKFPGLRPPPRLQCGSTPEPLHVGADPVEEAAPRGGDGKVPDEVAPALRTEGVELRNPEKCWRVVKTEGGQVRYLTSWDAMGAWWSLSPSPALGWESEDAAHAFLKEIARQHPKLVLRVQRGGFPVPPTENPHGDIWYLYLACQKPVYLGAGDEAWWTKSKAAARQFHTSKEVQRVFDELKPTLGNLLYVCCDPGSQHTENALRSDAAPSAPNLRTEGATQRERASCADEETMKKKRQKLRTEGATPPKEELAPLHPLDKNAPGTPNWLLWHRDEDSYLNRLHGFGEEDQATPFESQREALAFRDAHVSERLRAVVFAVARTGTPLGDCWVLRRLTIEGPPSYRTVNGYSGDPRNALVLRYETEELAAAEAKYLMLGHGHLCKPEYLRSEAAPCASEDRPRTAHSTVEVIQHDGGWTVHDTEDDTWILDIDGGYGLGPTWTNDDSDAKVFATRGEALRALRPAQRGCAKVIIRTVVAAALRCEEVVFSMPQPARHHDLLHKVNLMGIERSHYQLEQGFLLSDGSFATRGEAAEVAIAAGQVKHRNLCTPFSSEDLW